MINESQVKHILHNILKKQIRKLTDNDDSNNIDYDVSGNNENELGGLNMFT